MANFTKEQMLGYVVMTLKQMNKDEKEIRETVNKMKDNIEGWTETWAEEVYEDFI